ncbi:PQQ-dependent sugar dehydrogenase [Halomicroarcula sp. GCM10025709]|uniref:PQQ-dependent sugar dehydrogenase n=1 Tax=Halomicroarcula sp. GCM10025709 TaxID=3252669 RepID=UPI00360CA2D0
MATADDGTDRRFIVDQIGRIYVHGPDGLDPEPFLDLTDRLVAVGQNLPNWVAYDERGLLGLAFHPEFAQNRRFYVRYSAPPDDDELDHRERLSEFTATADGTRADPESERVLLDLPWYRPLHQAGTIEFGPDGYLYAALGDGLNPFNGQDITDNFKGSILRLDVDSRTDGKPYGIPADNPLVGSEGLDEHYAWGLRNPWKMAFSGDRLIVGDVGQATWEEVNVIERGGNYGWPLKEGFTATTHRSGPATRASVSSSPTAANRSSTRCSNFRTSPRPATPSASPSSAATSTPGRSTRSGTSTSLASSHVPLPIQPGGCSSRPHRSRVAGRSGRSSSPTATRWGYRSSRSASTATRATCWGRQRRCPRGRSHSSRASSTG